MSAVTVALLCTIHKSIIYPQKVIYVFKVTSIRNSLRCVVEVGGGDNGWGRRLLPARSPSYITLHQA